MRVLVFQPFPYEGGAQFNAIDIARGVRDSGQDVTVLSPAGPIVDRVTAAGLPWVELVTPGIRPSRRVTDQIRRLIDEHAFDLVHGYEWPPILEGYLGAWEYKEVATVGTVMSMSIPPFLPRTIPLVVGTSALQTSLAGSRSAPTYAVEPPVDTDADSPTAVSYEARELFRRQMGAGDDTVLVVSVARLVADLKLEGLLAAVEAVGALGREGYRISLAVVGDGPQRAEVEQAAAAANALVGRQVVQLTGHLEDPRAAYGAADVIIGMGGSALRGMAFGKPLVVQGEMGFWGTLTPRSAPVFLEHGWYGLGDGSSGVPRVREALRSLAVDPDLRSRLGHYSRSLVVANYSLSDCVSQYLEIYERSVFQRRKEDPYRGARRERSRVLGSVMAYQARRKAGRRLGRAALEDFNAPSRTRATSQISLSLVSSYESDNEESELRVHTAS